MDIAISDIVARVKLVCAERICIEAGHIYVDETPNEQHFASLKIGVDIANAVSEVASVIKMLFVDDYNPQVHNLDLAAYIRTAAGFGFAPDLVVMEAGLVKEAQEIVDGLRLGSKLRVDDDGHTQTCRKNIRLIHNTKRFSCCALDTALYMRKFRDYDFSFTVLPDTPEYRSQQKNVKKLLRIIGFPDPPFTNVFF